MRPKDTGPTAEQVLSGDRRALARAITLVESTRRDHRARAARLLNDVLPSTGEAVRVGISGPPGVGKSTFIEALGTHVTGLGHKVAVLAVDPTSVRSGGSILGDKTRMEELAKDPDAFIRPSPSGGELGGVARRTREAMLLCEAAGFDVVLIETVGVGQSELAVADMVDLFVLLASPSGGDDLQGIKRGMTKADGDLARSANHAAADIGHALHLLRPKHEAITSDVRLVSSPTGAGIPEAWEAIEAAERTLRESGALERMRGRQAIAWLWSELSAGLAERFRSDERVAAELPKLQAAVEAGEVSPTAAAQRLLDQLL